MKCLLPRFDEIVVNDNLEEAQLHANQLIEEFLCQK